MPFVNNRFENSSVSSIAGFVRDISKLTVENISDELRERIIHMAYTVIPGEIILINDMLEQLELHYVDKVSRLRLDQEKLTKLGQQLEMLLAPKS